MTFWGPHLHRRLFLTERWRYDRLVSRVSLTPPSLRHPSTITRRTWNPMLPRRIRRRERRTKKQRRRRGLGICGRGRLASEELRRLRIRNQAEWRSRRRNQADRGESRRNLPALRLKTRTTGSGSLSLETRLKKTCSVWAGTSHLADHERGPRHCRNISM